jgi:hypothetical protein
VVLLLGGFFQVDNPLLDGLQRITECLGLIFEHIEFRCWIRRDRRGIWGRISQITSAAASAETFCKPTAHNGAVSAAESAAPAVAKTAVIPSYISGVGGIAESSCASGHCTGSHGTGSIKTWHDFHLLIF